MCLPVVPETPVDRHARGNLVWDGLSAFYYESANNSSYGYADHKDWLALPWAILYCSRLFSASYSCACFPLTRSCTSIYIILLLQYGIWILDKLLYIVLMHFVPIYCLSLASILVTWLYVLAQPHTEYFDTTSYPRSINARQVLVQDRLCLSLVFFLCFFFYFSVPQHYSRILQLIDGTVMRGNRAEPRAEPTSIFMLPDTLG